MRTLQEATIGYGERFGCGWDNYNREGLGLGFEIFPSGSKNVNQQGKTLAQTLADNAIIAGEGAGNNYVATPGLGKSINTDYKAR